MKSLLFTSNWEKYFVTVDENLSQIKLDMGAKDFKETYDHSFFIRLDFPLESTFPNMEEEKKITKLLDYFEAALVTSQKDAKYVGAVSSKATTDLIFVAKELFELNSILPKIIKDYPYQSSWLKDDQWKIYESLLYPSEEDILFIYNRKLLQKYHDSHEESVHDLFQYQVFSNQDHAQSFLSEVYQDFKVLDTILTKDGMYIVQLVRKQEMTFIELNQVSLELHALAKKHQGYYVSCHYEDVHKEHAHA